MNELTLVLFVCFIHMIGSGCLVQSTVSQFSLTELCCYTQCLVS